VNCEEKYVRSQIAINNK